MANSTILPLFAKTLGGRRLPSETGTLTCFESLKIKLYTLYKHAKTANPVVSNSRTLKKLKQFLIRF